MATTEHATSGATLTHDELAALTEPRIVTELPGPLARAVIDADAKVTSPSLPRAYPLAPDRGAGAMLLDVDGNVFLDLNAAIAVCSTGHAHPDVVEAIREQAGRLLHYSASDFYLPIYGETCAVLDEIAPMRGPAKSFLTNSGTEAVEAAIKLARHETNRQYVIAFIGGFHGRSYGAVSLTASSAKYHEGFGPMLPGVVHAPFGADDTDHYIEKVIFKRLVKPHEIAAIVVEPVQGEGGYTIPPQGWLRYLRDLCTEHGILLVADEVQSGMGRTGKMWAVEHWDIEPDILLSGKGIASGMPLGAMIARADLMNWQVGAHGSTYGGNPLSCAAALASIRLIREGLTENAARVGAFMLARLREIAARQPIITTVRGLGLMVGVEFADGGTADAVEIECFQHGVLTLRAGDSTIRMSPPLVVNEEQAATGLRIFEAACERVAARSHS
ncbi:MAG TPA: aminotransferase class III-fold pyridoxal phosphate-dependent enzyme [Actinomycetota bacterium]|nr:aminotransferase class III-fold pyridoxal phosphate-dependent enzyme [Actinomycetota bacterium]